MSDWVKNLIEYNETRSAGNCPMCGSSKVKVEEMNIGRKSLTFVCESCGESEHFDGIHEGESK